MNIQNTTLAGACPVSHSRVLGRLLSALTPDVMALVDGPQHLRVLTGFSLPSEGALRALPDILRRLRGPGMAYVAASPGMAYATASDVRPLLLVEPLVQHLPDADLDRLLPAPPSAGGWHGCLCRFACGHTDLVMLRLPGADLQPQAEALLRMIWPVLREEALQYEKTAGTETDFAPEPPPEPPREAREDEALLWLIRARIDIAALVVNPQGLILRQNAAARRMILEGRVLMRRHGGLHACDADQTRRLRAAIADCAAAPAERGDRRLFLHPTETGAAVPVTLARYVHDGVPTSLVTLLLPEPPAPAQVERIARELGLTAAEARVAAMLQTGLPNRSAATSLGLTEQSFSTYAKRVFSKLQVSSRAEMAQMLTWQTHGGLLT